MSRKIVMLLVFFCMVVPIYFMVIGGFQALTGIMKMPPNLIPYNATLANYRRMVDWPMVTWFRNTVFVLVCTDMLTVLLCSMTGYVFAFYRFRMKELLWGILLSGLMLPRISMIIPLYVVVKHLGLSGSLLAVILPIAYYPVGIYLARIFFSTISPSLLESARLDGATELQVLTRIVMPMSRPIITCLALFASINALGDYIWQMLVLQKEGNRTLLVGMIQQSLVRSVGAGVDINPIGMGLATGTILLFPLLVMFVIANKYFTQSLSGAIKE